MIVNPVLAIRVKARGKHETKQARIYPGIWKSAREKAGTVTTGDLEVNIKAGTVTTGDLEVRYNVRLLSKLIVTEVTTGADAQVVASLQPTGCIATPRVVRR